MKPRIWMIAGAAVAVALLLGAGVCLMLPGLLEREQQVSAATSPDGSWSVAVVARPKLSGSYDIVVEVRDSRGKGPGAFVVGLTRDLGAAAREHAVSFVDGATAKVGSRTLEKSNFIRE